MAVEGGMGIAPERRGLPRELTSQVRRLDQYDLRRLQILIRGLLLDVDAPPDAEQLPGKVTYRQETVRCGKAECRTCPHGPYWYAYWKEGGKSRSRYIGRHLAGTVPEPVQPDLPRSGWTPQSTS